MSTVRQFVLLVSIILPLFLVSACGKKNYKGFKKGDQIIYCTEIEEEKVIIGETEVNYVWFVNYTKSGVKLRNVLGLEWDYEIGEIIWIKKSHIQIPMPVLTN